MKSKTVADRFTRAQVITAARCQKPALDKRARGVLANVLASRFGIADLPQVLRQPSLEFNEALPAR